MRPTSWIRTCVVGISLLATGGGAALQPAGAIAGFDPDGHGPAYPVAANGREAGVPSLRAYPTKPGAICIDGRLDEPDWIDAPAATGFTQFEPDRKGEAAEETVFKVLYDDDAVYVGVACYRHNGDPITSCLSRRDNIRSSDRIRIYLSPYNDMVTGYHFRLNPHGVKEDYYNYGDLYHDISWDAVWEADTHTTDEGWFAELRIPFSSIRYRSGSSMTWGFNVFQYIHSRGQRTAWSNWDRDQSGFMSRSGTVTGIDGIRPPRQLEVTPYILSSTTDPSDPTASGPTAEDWDRFGNFGADIKYGVTADLTLNATIQPDFGQVEADPSVLNLSPYETYYSERRPFFIEGAQFFYAPDNVVFYSRRIGTGSQNARIRYAAKLTGKTAGSLSTAVLLASTDETKEGRAHNLFRDGQRKAYYAIGRFGKQFGDGMHSINVMQTAVVRDRSSFEETTRNGYVTGADCELTFADRMYSLTASFVGSYVDPEERTGLSTSEVSRHGTGTRFEIEKMSGDWRFALTTRHQSDGLDLNDLGYINDPNHFAYQGWVTRVFHADDDGHSFLSSGTIHLRYYQSYIYAARSVPDPDRDGAALWSYDRGHRHTQQLHLEADVSTRSCWRAWAGVEYRPDGSDQYVTRFVPDGSLRGPLMTDPAYVGAWGGLQTDSRSALNADFGVSVQSDAEGSRSLSLNSGLSWVQNSRMSHSLSAEYQRRHADAQWIGNVENPGGGIGGVSYLFAEMDQETVDLTLRSSILFTRDSSLELYLQPYLSVGTHWNARELARPDSYDLRPFSGVDATGSDFTYGAVNVNMVYRWEYRPGSTLFVVWTHGRSHYDRRSFHGQPEAFEDHLRTDPLFDTEPENRFMVKLSYWVPV